MTRKRGQTAGGASERMVHESAALVQTDPPPDSAVSRRAMNLLEGQGIDVCDLMLDLAHARDRMVDVQIARRGVRDSHVLEARSGARDQSYQFRARVRARYGALVVGEEMKGLVNWRDFRQK
jgi:hypothetical protein